MSMKFSQYANDVFGKVSAGILLTKKERGEWLFLIVHPGGPFYRNKWDGFWSIPKGMVELGEDTKVAARREFFEETGIEPPTQLIDLGTTALNTGKIIQVYLAFGDGEFKNSNTFSMRWPPGSKVEHEFPEVDLGEWCTADDAKRMLGNNQKTFVDIARTYLD